MGRHSSTVPTKITRAKLRQMDAHRPGQEALLPAGFPPDAFLKDQFRIQQDLLSYLMRRLLLPQSTRALPPPGEFAPQVLFRMTDQIFIVSEGDLPMSTFQGDPADLADLLLLAVGCGPPRHCRENTPPACGCSGGDSIPHSGGTPLPGRWPARFPPGLPEGRVSTSVSPFSTWPLGKDQCPPNRCLSSSSSISPFLSR